MKIACITTDDSCRAVFPVKWVWYALGTGDAAGDKLMKWCVLQPHENSMCKAS